MLIHSIDETIPGIRTFRIKIALILGLQMRLLGGWILKLKMIFMMIGIENSSVLVIIIQIL